MDENKSNLLIWNLQIPVMVTLSEKETFITKPPPFFVKNMRISKINLLIFLDFDQ